MGRGCGKACDQPLRESYYGNVITVDALNNRGGCGESQNLTNATVIGNSIPGD
jgi:hypothetical protein